MADTPLADLIQPFCTSLDDLVRKIHGIHGAYQSANDKFYRESHNLVTKDAGEVAFYGMGASAFFGSVKQSIDDTNDEMQALTELAAAVKKCHTSLNTATTSADFSIRKAESILDSYRTDLIAIYGDATYPYTQLVDAIAELDLNSIIQQGGSAVSSVFQSVSSRLLMLATSGANSGEPTYQQHAANAIAAVSQLTTEIQSICTHWANQVHTDVVTFNKASVRPPFQPPLPVRLMKSLYGEELFPIKGKHAKQEEGGETVGVAIGPFWQGSAYRKMLWQQSGSIGAVPVQNVGTVNIGNAYAGAYVGRNKDGTFTAGLTAGASVVDLNDQALFGSKKLGATLGGNVTALSTNAQFGLDHNTLGADVGASLITASGSTGVDVAGVNAGVTGSVGLQAQLGFQIGEKTEIKLPLISIGFTFSW